MNVTFGIGGRPNNTAYRRYLEFTIPSETLAIADASGISVAPGIVSYHACAKDNFDYRHVGSANGVFLDCHVMAIRPSDIPFGFEKRFHPFWSARRP